MLKAYKYRMYPNKEQEKLFFQHFGACRFVYNWGLENKIRTYESDSKSISRFTLNKMLPELKSEHVWLKDINSQSLQGATLHLENAFTRFFREKKDFRNSNPGKTHYNHSQSHKDMMSILKPIKFGYQKSDGLKQNYTEDMKALVKPQQCRLLQRVNFTLVFWWMMGRNNLWYNILMKTLL